MGLVPPLPPTPIPRGDLLGGKKSCWYQGANFSNRFKGAGEGRKCS